MYNMHANESTGAYAYICFMHSTVMNVMTRDNTLNMTQGSPLRLLIRFSIPMLIGNLFQQAYNLADSVIVGRLLGSGALAAVGATGSVTFLFFS